MEIRGILASLNLRFRGNSYLQYKQTFFSRRVLRSIGSGSRPCGGLAGAQGLPSLRTSPLLNVRRRSATLRGLCVFQGKCGGFGKNDYFCRHNTKTLLWVSWHS